MATALLSPVAKQYFPTNSGAPAAGYKLYTYAANTTTPQATYTNRAGTVANANPIILDARGEAIIYLTPGVMYDYHLYTDQDVLEYTREDVSADAGDANAVSFVQRGSNAIQRSSQDKMRERVSVLDFIPVALHDSIRDGTNTTDLLAYLNNALASVASDPRAELVFPQGDYRISGAWAINRNAIVIRGDGRARLVSTSATADLIQIGNGVGNFGNIKIEGLCFTATVAKTDGACIYIRNCNDVRIRDIIAAVNIHDGIVFEGGSGQFGYYLDSFLFTYFSGDGIRQQAGGGIGVQDIHVENGLIDAGAGGSATAVGWRFKSGGGTYARYVDVLGGGTGILTLPDTGNAVNYSFFDQVLADTATGHCWELTDNGGVVLGWTMSNCWGNSSVGGDGFFAGGTGPAKIRNVQISNSIFANNWLNGVRLFRTDNHKVVDSTIAGNNKSNTANLAGILVDAACSNYVIADNIIDNEWFAGIGGNQKYGILVQSGSGSNFSITDNVARNNQLASYLIQATGTGRNISGNVPAYHVLQTPTLLNGWLDFGGTWKPARYWKDGNGMVHLEGTVKSGAFGVDAFVLPAGYVPSGDQAFVTASNGLNTTAIAVVKSGGNVQLLAGPGPGTTAFVTLDGVSFRAA